MRLLLIKERLFLFGEFALSKSQYLYNKQKSSHYLNDIGEETPQKDIHRAGSNDYSQHPQGFLTFYFGQQIFCCFCQVFVFEWAFGGRFSYNGLKCGGQFKNYRPYS